VRSAIVGYAERCGPIGGVSELGRMPGRDDRDDAREHPRSIAPLFVGPRPARTGAFEALGERAEWRHHDGTTGRPGLRQREAEGLGACRRVRHEAHPIMGEELRQVARIVATVHRQHPSSLCHGRAARP
jgi:hypothetical protein